MQHPSVLAKQVSDMLRINICKQGVLHHGKCPSTYLVFFNCLYTDICPTFTNFVSWLVFTHIVMLVSSNQLKTTIVNLSFLSAPGSGHCGRLSCCCSSRGSWLDPRGEVPDEPRCAALLQQRGYSLHSLPAAG